MVRLVIADGIAEVVLDAPYRLNAVDVRALEDLAAAYDEAAAGVQEGTVRALVLRGEGRAFCAGRNLGAITFEDDDAYEFLDATLTPLLRTMAAFPAPTFAAAQGACLGVGLGLLIATDVVYVAEDAKIGSPFANLGLMLDSGGHWLFTERLGSHRALDLMYTGDLMTGADAVAGGLFSRAVPAADLLEFTRTKADRAARGPLQSLVASHQLVGRIRDERLGLWEAIRGENDAQGVLGSSEDYREGLAAFREKRQPRFGGQ
ncbi:enoyl-CoA hydratase/isomerase family protein [Arthrobacter agilis]|uniref:enoyl-CoA hydratase/isomerase family protein n=1 Tax=Arthrobacter agilis TaxID=37921 RepID=UPI000B3645F2|nr:enoyl-CoA hydratase-related protein [Arthrobacter agilis]OUM43222.1 crotonase [Arthrobacter agilis]PPB46129.1 crotonase [Arthrobacter agilis]TPV25707.1 enoyl-CoA hydratase/isomerase family protein [Arthrobacter agilis]